MLIEVKGDIISDDDQWLYDWLEYNATSPVKVQRGLDAAAGAPVEVVINSYGGSVFAGSEIYTKLKDYAGEVTVKIVGIAASAASVIAMAGNKVLMSPTAQLMIHNAAVISEGDNRDHRATAEMLEGVNKSIAAAYKLKTGLEEKELLDLMDKETFFTAETAKEKGFIDDIMFTEEIANRVPELVASAVKQSIPHDLVKKMRSAAAKFKPQMQLVDPLNNTENVKVYTPEKQKEEEKAMTKEELRAKFPEAVAQIENEAKESERGRISKLNALAAHPDAKAIIDAAIKDGKEAEEVAIEILNASMQRKEKVGADRENDSKNSGVEKVEVTEAPAEKDAADKEEEELKARFKKAAEAENKRGGRI